MKYSSVDADSPLTGHTAAGLQIGHGKTISRNGDLELSHHRLRVSTTN